MIERGDGVALTRETLHAVDITPFGQERDGDPSTDVRVFGQIYIAGEARADLIQNAVMGDSL